MSSEEKEETRMEAEDPMTTTATTGGSGGASSWLQAAQDASTMASQTVLVEDLERQYVAIRDERDASQKELQETQSKLTLAYNELQSLQEWERVAADRQNQLSLAQGQVQALQEEKKAVEERLDRMQAEADKLREEISRLTKSNDDLTKSMAEQEIQSKLHESEAIPLLHEKQRLQTELGSLTAHANWLEQELAAKTHDYQKLQQESRDKHIQLQLQLDQTLNDKEAAQVRLGALSNMERELQEKVQILSKDVLRMKQEMTEMQETTELSIRDERRVVELQKEHLKRWEQRYNDVVHENQDLQKGASEAMKQSEKELQDERRELEQKYTNLLEEQAAEYEAKLVAAQSSQLQAQQAAAESRPRRRLALAAATAAQEQQEMDEDDDDDGPLSLTELYTRLEETKDALKKEKRERERWQLMYGRVDRDIRATAPQLVRQRQEYDMAIDQIQDYQKRLEEALAERDDSRQDVREARHEAATLKRRMKEKQAETQELAKQVQALLVSRAGGQVAGGIPTSIEEIQSQNQRLLSEHRRLTDKVEELENRLQTDTLKTKLDAAESELAGLREERRKQEVLAENLVQQRDLYRALLAKHDSSLLGSEKEELTALEMAKQQSERAKRLEQNNKDLEGDLAAARSEIDKMGRAKEEMSERLARYEAHAADMTKTVDKLERDLLSSRSQVARAEADSQYHKEKCQGLEQSLERSRDEITQVNRVKDGLEGAITNLQEAVSKANTESARLASEKQQAEARLRLFDTQLKTAESAEKRLTEENGQLRTEVARQGSVIDSIRRIELSLSAKTESEKEELQRTNERITQQLDQVQSRHAAEVEALRGRIQDLEARKQVLDTSKEKAQAESMKAKKDVLEAKSEIQSLSSKCTRLESQLRSARIKLGETDDDTENVEETMQAKIETLTSDLEAAREEASSLKERAANYQKIAKESEDALAELRAATNEFKSDQEKTMSDLQNQIESMKKEDLTKQDIIRELTDDLAGQRGEREKLEAELQAQILSLKTEMQNNEKDVESAKAAVAAMKLDIENLRVEADRTQNNYERELSLHAQARTSLREAREEAEGERRQRLAAQEQLGSLKNELDQQREIWEQEKSALQEASQLVEKSLKESREQNALLHTQVETLGEMVEKSQSSRIAAAADFTSEEVGDLQKTLTELREVVKFLRSENEMIQTELGNTKRTADRERATANVVKRSLEEARAELQAMQASRDGGTGGDAEQIKGLKERLTASEEQVSILGDSNRLLREDAEQLRKSLSSLKTELDTANKLARPAEEARREHEVKIASLEAEKESLSRDLDDWKNRVKSLVSKFNQIDPEEHNQLKRQVDQLKKEKESLNAWQKSTEEENTRIRNIAKNLNQKFREQKSVIEEQKQEIEKLSADKALAAKVSSADSEAAKQRDELKTRMAEMEKDVASKKAELDGMSSQNDRLRERLRQFQTNLRETKSKEKAAADEITALKAKTTELEAKVAEKEQLLSASAAKVSSEQQRASELAPPTTSKAGVSVDVESSKPKPTTVPESKPPAVPPGGFKFGPSDGRRKATTVAQETEKPSIAVVVTSQKASIGGATSSLRADAQPFQPSASAPVASGQNESPSKATDTKTAAPSSKPSKMMRRLSGEKQELSFKEKLLERKRKLEAEKLLEKKRKLEAALKKKRKLEAEKLEKEASEDNATKPSESQEAETIPTAEEDQPLKRAKLSSEESRSDAPETERTPSVPVSATEEPPTTSAVLEKDSKSEQPLSGAHEVAGSQATPVHEEAKGKASSDVVEAASKADVAETEGIAEEREPDDAMEGNGHGGEEVAEEDEAQEKEAGPDDEENEPGTEEEEAATMQEEKEEALEADIEEKPDIPFGGAPANPFVSSTFGTPSTGATTFGQSSSLAQGSAATTAPTTFGAKPTTQASAPSGAFLNIKPPGSSTLTPTFSFGKTGTITLPTPSQSAPSPSPFGVFGGGAAGTPFGGFGSGTGSLGSRPLFGAPPAAAAESTQEEPSDGEDKMDDGDGDNMEAEG